MFFTVASALMFASNRRLIEVFPKGVKKVWNDWELRALILISLILQILLIILGNRRKDIPRTRLRITLWSAYLLADWVATVALGIISRDALEVPTKTNSYFSSKPYFGSKPSSESSECNYTNEIMSFWAPFLLLHLGGPDTITAYSLEDNELWLRHLVGLVIQTGVALYVFLLAWPGCSWLPILSIFMQVAGLIKYGERTWALMSANTEHFRDSMLTKPDPGPNYPIFMEDYALRKSEGFDVTVEEVSEPPLPIDDQFSYPAGKGKLISEAYDLFQTFRRLFVDLILTFQDLDGSQSYFRNLELPTEAFHLVEVELGFAFDVLYTKAPLAYSFTGFMLRLASLSCTLWAFAGFVFLCDKVQYHTIDEIITYLLLIVAILLEIYAVVIMLQSDWMDHWLSQHNKTRDVLIFPFLRRPNKSWWSNSMAQYNLLSVSLKEKPAVCHRIQKFLKMDQYREKHRYKRYNKVSDELKDLIFNHFMKFTGSNHDLRALCTHRGSFSLSMERDCPPLDWSIRKVEFDQSILIWHIATDLCYYMEVGDKDQDPADISSSCRESKNISDYMLYLLVMCPFMLPMGIGLIRFRDTCADAMEFFKDKDDINGKAGTCKKLLDVNFKDKDDIDRKAKACQKLLDVNTEIPPAKVKGDRSKSVLFDACMLAKSLRTMGKERKWVVMSHVWVEMLAYAATHCRGNHHAQQLRRGGELVTHVWLLMAHLGITEQFQISQGHARAKLIVK